MFEYGEFDFFIVTDNDGVDYMISEKDGVPSKRVATREEVVMWEKLGLRIYP